jgi:hypothetical protein
MLFLSFCFFSKNDNNPAKVIGIIFFELSLLLSHNQIESRIKLDIIDHNYEAILLLVL